MREWALKSGDPLSLALVSDARLGQTDYTDDQIWELTLGGGEPLGLALQTTFGLRARAFRIFPRFSEGDATMTDPADFARPPVLRRLFPNYILLDFSPFPDIDVTAELWVPEPHTVAGRYFLMNRSERDRNIRLEIIGQLTPNPGQRMAPIEIQATTVLAGQTGNLFPLIFVTGGPETGTGSYPSLLQAISLPPGEAHQIVWTHAARLRLEESFTQAREVAARKWDAEQTYLELLNASQIEIFTGNPDWDAAFMLTQRNAYSLLAGPGSSLPNISFILARQPDQGYSIRGDGSDYNHLRNGQTPLDTFYLAGLLLPGGVQIIKNILLNFLAVQNEDGFIDWKPGLAGQSSHILATPILATLAWRVYEIERDPKFLEEHFSPLLKFFHAWFQPAHDRDSDGIPEWDHLSQSGTEEHPSYSRWYEWSHGIEISTAESPALSAFLYQECQCLKQIATVLGVTEELPGLENTAERLRLAVEIAWDPERCSYHDVDRDSHFSTRKESLGEHNGSGVLWVNRKFEQPVRLLIHIDSATGVNCHPSLIVHGISATGQPRLKKIPEERFKWFLGRGIFTGERIYQAIEQVEILNLQPEDHIEIYSAGYEQLDQTALLPIWAGIPDSERTRIVVEQTITNPHRFWRPFGLPACIDSPTAPDAVVCQSTNLIWNTLIGEGLVRYGYRDLAAELVTRLMNSVAQNLKTFKAFRNNYHTETGQGVGERNTLQGLAPLGMFLNTLGVQLISPQQVMLSGFNPFPWPITVKYRGLTVLRLKEKSTVIFPDGQTITIDDPAPQVVALQIDQG